MPTFGEHNFEYYIDDSGIVRWKKSNNVPPTDCLEKMDITEATRLRSMKVARIEQDEAIEAYKKRMENHVYSDEELAEMQNAFGEGETVVDVFTGKRIKL